MDWYGIVENTTFELTVEDVNKELNLGAAILFYRADGGNAVMAASASMYNSNIHHLKLKLAFELFIFFSGFKCIK